MGCNSSTSARPSFDKHQNNQNRGNTSPSNEDNQNNKNRGNTNPSNEDNHNDEDRVRTRDDTNGEQNRYEDETDKKLKDLEEEKKEKAREKEEYDRKMRERIEEEKREREGKRKRAGDEKNKQEEEERGKQKEEREKEGEEKRRQEQEEDRRTHEAEQIRQEEQNEPQSRDMVDSAHGQGRNKKGLPYRDIHSGLHEYSADFRVDGKPTETSQPPDFTDLYTDHEFTLESALGKDGRGLEWKRPQEFCDAPCLFAEGTTRFDIGQGSAGTCWFLSLVASISEREDLMKQIYPDTAYPSPGTADYRGMFHCRFWRFGKWEDLYTDDKLPVIYGNKLWGAKSATDSNEMWVALLEKSFAKFHGSYLEVYGGQSVDAFLTLTGGVGERVDLQTAKPEYLFRRLTNAIQAKALVTCTVPAEKDGVCGLVGAHAYSLTGTTVVPYQRQKIRLVRIRNPWGKCEWTGPWSDKSPEWGQVPEGSVCREDKDDGEFWISLDDFFTYFSQTSICSITPDFDMDGRKDCLEYITEMYGEWRGESAASYKNIMKNPRFLISVTDDGVQENGLVPLVVQLIQWVEHRKGEKFSIYCDIYKVLAKHTVSGEEKYITEKMGEEETVYFTEKQHSFRHCLLPGDYMIVPSTRHEGEETEFLIRVFSPCPLTACSKVDDAAVMMSCDMDDKLNNLDLKHLQYWFGTWKSGVNAGGQISHPTHNTNPQVAFTITEKQEAVVFNMMQENSLPKLPLGFKVYRLDPGEDIPMTADCILGHYEDAPPTTDGELGKFVIGWDVNAPYMLPAGQYCAVAFTDQPNEEKDIGLVVKSSGKLRTQEFNLG